MAKAVLITGGNRGDVRALLRRAAGLIGERIGRIVRSSACYESAPWGFRAEQSFWNQVLEVETPLHPEELLEAVLSVEAVLGRDRVQEGLEKASTGERYASRTLDVDILFYDDEVIRTPRLEIPHPRLGGREFVLRPLCELMPERRHPVTGERMRDLLKALEENERRD
ncbi:2-amino-4-hydroxy-6-hydroxymethyldihydropteridine diphosphokinase [uncultured Alistipes sp.]|uniref:2-amino-4-hydroxy-6- hydroxymethyldihydropteridine diphosphokinase n=1 Tax=uncultured Alistipes sp. TaxID=538949 RepID=UPI002622E0E8|nr:2-amino-4-hydroxy-6-hydroxymethyldihydropteridine diphosphokinase [uncultured Alistipes sp.]